PANDDGFLLRLRRARQTPIPELWRRGEDAGRQVAGACRTCLGREPGRGRRRGKILTDEPGIRRICRYALLFHVWPSEVARRPAWELDLLDHYRAREPAPVTRVEVALARLMAMYANAHKAEGSPDRAIADFMTFSKAWDGITEEEIQQTLIDLA